MTSTFILLFCMIARCANTPNEVNQSHKKKTTKSQQQASKPATPRHFAGALSNGMKGDSIFFDIPADGKTLQHLTFKGYWRCSGKLEKMTAGPEGAFTIVGGKVNDHISEPPNGGSTAWRYDLKADIQGDEASGTFRMNINNLGCDTYLLKWTAAQAK
jgi:hypothetical protein